MMFEGILFRMQTVCSWCDIRKNIRRKNTTFRHFHFWSKKWVLLHLFNKMKNFFYIGTHCHNTKLPILCKNHSKTGNNDIDWKHDCYLHLVGNPFLRFKNFQSIVTKHNIFFTTMQVH